VKNRPPVAALTASLSIINEKETVSFDASSSYDLDGTIVSYSWGFGDGTAATGVKVEHTYEYLGSYTVTLTVVDNDGATDDVTSSVTVTPGSLNISPVAIVLKSAKTVNINEIATFNASLSYDPDGTITSYVWTFGDGTTAAGVAADHVYSEEGTYTVTLTVTDNDGLTDVATTNIIATTTPVQNQSPVASFTESAQAISLGESIHFDGSGSSDPDGTITSYAWTFGDGTTAAGVAADHVYSEEGTYTVTLTVTDNDGASSSVFAEMTVGPDTTLSVAVLAGIGIGIAALVAALLIGLFIRKKKKKKPEDI